MSTSKLEFEYDYDFFLIGIYCHHRDYRLAWSLNRHLGLDLKKDNDYKLKSGEEFQYFPLYTFFVESQDLYYYLVGNRGENGWLIPEKKDVDYFLIVEGLFERSKKEILTQGIAKLKEVLTAVEIDPESLNSRQNLLME
ncbi:IPExxxVDY family protein [bacterium SCSIO 12741]|nr:IPExxxVDY family protein [bacterium SCSIO 12741]